MLNFRLFLLRARSAGDFEFNAIWPKRMKRKEKRREEKKF